MPLSLSTEGALCHMKRTRLAFQITVLLAVVVTGFRHAMGWSRTSIETYCPFGGLETAYALITESEFTCAAGERNLALFLGLIALTLFARKSFCGWVCPVGTVSEWCAALGTRWFGRKRRDSCGARLHALEPPRAVDRVLRWLRLPVLLLILYFTYRTGELIFRGFDPYYILFSFHGHDVKIWSYLILAVVLLGIVFVPMAWCRYLCPLGITLWPFARFGGLRLVRNAGSCTDCGACDRSCPQSLDPSKADQVLSGDCTLCLKCTSVCRDEALDLQTGMPKTRVPSSVVPFSVVCVAALALLSTRLFSIPTLSVEYELTAGRAATQGTDSVTMTVVGVTCKDKARRAADTLSDTPGILRFVAHASYNRVKITYRPDMITIPEIRELLEGPVFVEETGTFLFNQYSVVEIDGREVDRIELDQPEENGP